MRRAIFYWGAKQRLNLLTTFRARVNDYYASAEWDYRTNEWVGDDDTSEIRRRINEEMRAVGAALHFVGIGTTVHYDPPAATGGLAGPVALLDNVFNFPRLGLPHTTLLDPLDRAIGVYRSWLGPLWRKLFNPFYWLGWFLALVAEVPFRLLGAAGFDTTKIEGSFWGKAVKAVTQFVMALGAALGVLEKLDLLSPVVSAVHKLFDGLRGR